MSCSRPGGLCLGSSNGGFSPKLFGLIGVLHPGRNEISSATELFRHTGKAAIAAPQNDRPWFAATRVPADRVGRRELSLVIVASNQRRVCRRNSGQIG